MKYYDNYLNILIFNNLIIILIIVIIIIIIIIVIIITIIITISIFIYIDNQLLFKYEQFTQTSAF